MRSQRRKAARIAAAVLVSAAGALATAVAVTTPSAHADPSFASSLVGVGSDTIQDIFNAYAGADPAPPSANTAFYTPLHSTSATNNITVSSWDALPPGGNAATGYCITTKLGGPSFDRPNGSGAGVTALLDAVNGTPWEATQASLPSCTNATVSVTGQIDFARSASGPKSTGTTLTFIPFGRDAVAYAYYDHGTNTISALTIAQLQSLYSSSTGTITVGGSTVEACLPPAGSAVRKNFEAAIGVTDSQGSTAANASGCGQTIEQNNGNTFYTYASSLPTNTDAVDPFSVGSWVAQNNGLALDNSGTARTGGVSLGNPGGIGTGGKPYDGSGTSETADPTYYGSTFGVTVYVVVPTNKITGFTANKALQSLFVGSTSAICSAPAQTTSTAFGLSQQYPTGVSCGITSVTGNS